MKIKLRFKLTIIFCLSVLFVLLVGYSYLIFHLKNHIEDTLKTNLKHQIFLGKELLEEKINQNNLYSLDIDALADRLGRQQDLRVTIIDKNGKVLGDSELGQEEIEKVENHLDRPEIQEAINKGIGISQRYSYTIKKYMLYMAVCFGKPEKIGFLRYAIPISYIKILEDKLKNTVSGALFLVFILSLIFSLIISFILSRPLEELAKVAKSVAKGNFSQKPHIYSKDEIGELADALTYMSSEIKNKIDIIKQETAKLNTVLSSMSEGVMVVDENGRIILMNPSLKKIFFVDLEPEYKTPIEVIRNHKVQEMVDKIIKEKQKFLSQEIIVDYPTNKILKVNAVAIIRNELIEGAVLVFHDITELHNLEKIRQDFVANVSHELRTPITNIKGYAETILEGALEDKENIKEFINIIYQESNRMANLIDDLLDLSKIESGKIKMNFSALEIKPIIERCLAVLEKPIKEKNLSVSFNIPKSLSKVMADEIRLTQVLLNLLDNAVKYTNEGGKITIDVFEKDDFVQVDITDTGIGIPEEDLPRIFERFYRVDKARSRQLGGTGLGLSIVKHIVLAHGGKVWVKSKLGSGSTFSFTIPRA